MAELSDIHFIYAIQYLRSHLQGLVEAENVQQVDQDLAKLLKQASEEERADQFRELIVEHDKAYDWWLAFNPNIQPATVKGFTGSSPQDSNLGGDSAPDLLLITCAKCGFANPLLSWNDSIPCQNRDRPKHNIEL